MPVLLANPHRLSTLTDQQREWLQGAARDAAGRSTDLVDRDAHDVTIACQNGAQVANASGADLAWLRTSFDPVYAQLEQDPQTKTFIDRIEQLKASTSPGPALSIPADCAGPLSPGTVDSPVEGTWQTERLTESQIVQAFVAAGGSEKEGHEAFQGNSFVFSLRFENGIFTQFESIDGSSPEAGYHATYEIEDGDTISLSGCPEPQAFHFVVTGDTLRLHVVKPCGNDAIFTATLFATFPMTRTE